MKLTEGSFGLTDMAVLKLMLVYLILSYGTISQGMYVSASCLSCMINVLTILIYNVDSKIYLISLRRLYYRRKGKDSLTSTYFQENKLVSHFKYIEVCISNTSVSLLLFWQCSLFSDQHRTKGTNALQHCTVSSIVVIVQYIIFIIIRLW